MHSLMSCIKRSVHEQHRFTALEDCFSTWDGNIDLDVITQGLHDRYTAIGQPLEGIRFRRTSLKVVEADLLKDGEVKTVKWDYSLGMLSWKSPDFTDVLSPKEQTTLQLWLKDNYYEH